MSNNIVDQAGTAAKQHQSAKRRMLRCEAVAQMLDLSKKRVYILAREGVLPHVRVGRAIRFNEAELEEWIAAGGSSYAEARE